MSWQDIVKDKKQGPRKKLYIDEEYEKKMGWTYFQEKAGKMQNALKVIQHNFDMLEKANAKKIAHGLKTDPDFYMSQIKEELDEINAELVEMETYAERLRVDSPMNINIARVTGTDLGR